MKKYIIWFVAASIFVPFHANALSIAPSLTPGEHISINIPTQSPSTLNMSPETSTGQNLVNTPTIQSVVTILWDMAPQRPFSVDVAPKSPYDDDTHVLRFVSFDSPLSDALYVPKDLVSIHTKYIRGSGLLRREARDALAELSVDFYKKFRKNIVVNSAYRDFSYQENIANKTPECVQTGFCAIPGRSEHQLGLAVDIFGLSNYGAQYTWFRHNAHKYGFTQSYQKGREVDGYAVEPWHWRYVGVEMASYLYEKNITFTELARAERKRFQ